MGCECRAPFEFCGRDRPAFDLVFLAVADSSLPTFSSFLGENPTDYYLYPFDDKYSFSFPIIMPLHFLSFVDFLSFILAVMLL